MRCAAFSCMIAVAASLSSMGGAARADEPQSTWLLSPSARDSATANATDPNAAATVSFAVRTASGADIPRAHVTMDGSVLTGALHGWAVTIPPGEHLFEFGAPGYAPQDHMVTIHPGTEDELITVTLAPVELPKKDAAVEAPVWTPTAENGSIADHLARDFAPNASRDPGEGESDPWMVTYVAGGAAVVALGVGTVLGVVATNQVAGLKRTCAPNCTDAQVSSVRSNMWGADIALGVGIVSAGVAVVWALTHPRAAASDTSKRNARSLPVDLHLDVDGVAGQF